LVVIAQVYTLSGGEKQRLASSSCPMRRHRRSIVPARIEVFHDRKIRLERHRGGAKFTTDIHPVHYQDFT
jgi:hypothetical protein